VGGSDATISMVCSAQNPFECLQRRVGGSIGSSGSLDPVAIDVVRASVGSLGRFVFEGDGALSYL
jgi:hypothetical protein